MAAAVPYALSVHGFIDKVGADAGFAAIIGVALVVIMLFIHARETASLRERAEDAEDRVEYLERAVEQLGRVAAQATQLAQQAQAGQARPGVAAAPASVRNLSARPAPAPAVAAAYAGSAAPPGSLGPPPQLPAAPYGTAGPALSSATRMIPEPEPASSNGHLNGNAVPAPVLPTPAPAPATVAAGAPVPAPQIPSLPRAADPRGDTVPPRTRDTETGRAAPRRNYGRASEERSSSRRIVPVLVAVLLVAVIAVAAVLVLHHDHHKGSNAASVTQTHTSTASTTGKGSKSTHKVTVDPRSVTVAVLNGTTTANLAADVSQQLGKLGFKQGPTRNFSTQSLTTTTIGFIPGHRSQALAVAKALKVKYANVLKVNASTQQIICPAGSACPDDVFVVLGTDLASDA